MTANYLGATAMRCVRILDSLGSCVDRAGVSGPVAEIYPAAALHRWGLPAQRYKQKKYEAERRALVADLCRGLSGVCDVGAQFRELCEQDDNNLDALVASLAARASMIGRTILPEGDEELRLARIEGWIHVPDCELGDLAG